MVCLCACTLQHGLPWKLQLADPVGLPGHSARSVHALRVLRPRNVTALPFTGTHPAHFPNPGTLIFQMPYRALASVEVFYDSSHPTVYVHQRNPAAQVAPDGVDASQVRILS